MVEQHFKAIVVLLAVFTLPLNQAKATVVTGDATFVVNSEGSFYPEELQLTKSISDTGGGLFSIGFSNPTLSLPNPDASFTIGPRGIAEGYSFYTVKPGALIDSAFAASTTPLVTNMSDGPFTATLKFHSSPFPSQSTNPQYFAYWDQRHQPGQPYTDIPSDSDLYGWVEIKWTGSQLEILDSATVEGGGIVVGTDIQVLPEPATAWFGLAMLLGIVTQRSRSRIQAVGLTA